MREIDLNEWTLFGGGGEGNSYYHKTDDSIVLKLYQRGGVDDRAELDCKMSNELIKLGFRTPRVLETVSCNGQPGTVSERLKNKVSFSRLISDEPDKLEECARITAKTMKKIHSMVGDPEVMKNRVLRTTMFFKMAAEKGMITQTQMRFALDEIAKGNDCTTLCFGDPSSGNFVLSGEPDPASPHGYPKLCEENVYLIDIGTFGIGLPYYDWGILLAGKWGVLPDAHIEKQMHFDRETCIRYVNAVENAYYDGDAEKIKEMEKNSKAYVAMVMLGVMMYNIGEENAYMLKDFLGE